MSEPTGAIFQGGTQWEPVSPEFLVINPGLFNKTAVETAPPDASLGGQSGDNQGHPGIQPVSVPGRRWSSWSLPTSSVSASVKGWKALRNFQHVVERFRKDVARHVASLVAPHGLGMELSMSEVGLASLAASESAAGSAWTKMNQLAPHSRYNKIPGAIEKRADHFDVQGPEKHAQPLIPDEQKPVSLQDGTA